MKYLILLFALLAAPASAQSFAPYEWLSYCVKQGEGSCDLNRKLMADDLAWIHASVNDGMTPDNSQAGEWIAFPESRKGNCADYSISYRAAAIAFGLDPRALHLEAGYVGEISEANVHSVLVVDLGTAGVWVLDSLARGIYSPDARPYVWTPIAKQQPTKVEWTQ